MPELLYKGAMPPFYDRYLQPILGGPYIAETVLRVKAMAPRRLLETACGTGAVTYAIADALPGTEIIATDMSEPMIEYAKTKRPDIRIVWKQADAQQLPFPKASFDLVVCQFGVMFFGDKLQGMSEARRVLQPKGRFLFTVWDDLSQNELESVGADAVADMFPDDPPTYMRRVPFGYHDTHQITNELGDAGFADVQIETVHKSLFVQNARQYAIGICQGGGLRAEIEKRNSKGLTEATDLVTAAIERRFGTGSFTVESQALITTALV